MAVLDSSAETLISTVSSFMHAGLGPKTHLNYAQRSSKLEASVFKKCSGISEASLCLSSEQVTDARQFFRHWPEPGAETGSQ